MQGNLKKGDSIKTDKIKRHQSTENVKNNCHISDLVQAPIEDNKGKHLSDNDMDQG